MAYSNSSLISKTILSPYYDPRNGKKILKITPHHAAAVNVSLDGLGSVFRTRQASANYGIDSNGQIAMFVEEKNRAWTSSNANNDYQAVTIEISNSKGAPNWEISDKAWDSLVKLCVDICRRNNISSLNYTGDTSGNLTRHNMFAATACPGPYLQSRLPELAKLVNAQLSKGTPAPVVEPEPIVTTDIYRVQVGAYAVKANAEAMQAKLKAQGYSTIIVQVDGLYKVQVGAYTVLKNAETMQAKLKAQGYSTIITSKTGKATPSSIKVGDTVRLKKGALAYNGQALASFVYNRDHVVSQISGDRAVITYGGVVVAAVKVSDLI